MCKQINCDYCARCECGHNADEHLAGEGHCFKCSCNWFKFSLVKEFERLNLSDPEQFPSYDEFVKQWTTESR